MSVSFFGIIVLAVIVIAVVALLGGVVGGLKRFRIGHAMLDCPHCGQQTRAAEPHCQECGQEI